MRIAISNPSAKKWHNFLIGTKAVLHACGGSGGILIVNYYHGTGWKNIDQNKIENMESRKKADQGQDFGK